MQGQRPPTQRSISRPGFFARAAAVVALAGLPLACGGSGKPAQAQGPPAVPVKIEIARSLSLEDASEYVATIKSLDSTVVMPQVEGTITRIFVRSGDRVSPGTPLMEIDPAKQSATVKSLEDTRAAKLANLEYARQQFERVSRLNKEGVTSGQDLDQARSALETAQAELQALDAQVTEQRVQLHYHSVAAPRTGIVGDIPVRVGDRVTVSTRLTTVDRPGSFEAYVAVPVERSPGLRMGMAVKILDTAGAALADSRITFISPRVDDQTQTVLVKSRIQGDEVRLRTEQLVRARLVWGTHEGPVVPVLAVARLSGQYFAFVAEEEKGGLVARQKPIKVGEIVGNDYIVLDGIKPGDRVIVSGTQVLLDGAPVAPQA
jgi:RND family efflux transporter MFP subunit